MRHSCFKELSNAYRLRILTSTLWPSLLQGSSHDLLASRTLFASCSSSFALNPSPLQARGLSSAASEAHTDASSGQSEFLKSIRSTAALGASVLGFGLVGSYLYFSSPVPVKYSSSTLVDSPSNAKANVVPLEETITNWSSTHEVHTSNLYRPESLQELEAVVAMAHEKCLKIRPVGSGISPNGIGLSSAGMVNVGFMDKIVEVDKEKNQVKVQAGARVEQVVEALRPHGLTLQNYASVREQQIGGFVQVSAHGTGMNMPPVDEQVVGLKIVTPAKGTVEMTRASHPEIFDWAKCSLGALGVLAEVTLQCVPAHKLLEHTFVSNTEEIRKNHKKWLEENKHLRYMWIPYTDSIVVVKCNNYDSDSPPPKLHNQLSEQEKLMPVREYYLKCVSQAGTSLVKDGEKQTDEKTEPASGTWSGTGSGISNPKILSEAEVNQLSFTELRDHLLALDPLNFRHVATVNVIESNYWKQSEGYRIGWSDEILGFDCGGQQWVSEVAFPVFSITNELSSTKDYLKDLDFVEDILSLIKERNIAAPSPIEQRWSKSSQSPMSPVYDSDNSKVFSWVGIIMYLCSEDTQLRNLITQKFFDYKYLTAQKLWDKYDAHEHWAKFEVPENAEMKKWLVERLAKRYSIEKFNELRQEFDPKNILSNVIMDELFPRGTPQVA